MEDYFRIWFMDICGEMWEFLFMVKLLFIKGGEIFLNIFK